MALANVVRAAQAAFRTPHGVISASQLTPQVLEPVAGAVEAVQLADVRTTPDAVSCLQRITFVPVVEDAFMTVGVFLLGPGHSLPLHDHPHMAVVSRLLCGSMTVDAYDWVDRPRGVARPTDAAVQWAAPSTRCLLPTTGNVHAFTAGPAGAAMFDVLAPPYAWPDRPCVYYKDDGTAADDAGDGTLRRLVELDPPPFFECDVGASLPA